LVASAAARHGTATVMGEFYANLRLRPYLRAAQALEVARRY
jgi:hypothetical protein